MLMESILPGKMTVPDLKAGLPTGGVFALGNFDGVHRGHRLVVEAAVARARELGTAACALTFEPHPRAFFQPEVPPFRLTAAAAKERLLKALGIAQVVTLPFDAALAHLSAQDFVEKILGETFKARHIVAGHDFAFGQGRAGTMQKLTEWLAPSGVGVTEIAPLADAQGVAFSSSAIRDRLRHGDTAAAAEMLGRDWQVEGTVVKGAQRGRGIGVPTANIALGDYLRPQFGVYAVRADRAGEPLMYKGVANIGVRPTVGGVSENLEAHLFDFDRDIYGQDWAFALTRFIRPEMKFDSFDALKIQIVKDISAAKAALND